MRNSHIMQKQRGFTLTETVIAIGVVAVLLTSFIAVLGPTRQSIKNVVAREVADRMTETLEQELSTLRPGQNVNGIATSFDKAFDWILNTNASGSALLMYNYNADPSSQRPDDTLAAYVGSANDRIAGRNTVTMSMARRQNDPLLLEDIAQSTGQVFMVKLKQLVYQNGQLVPGTQGQIVDPNTGTPVANAAAYPGAAIAYQAEFYLLPTKATGYLTSFNPASFTRPTFIRTGAVLR